MEKRVNNFIAEKRAKNSVQSENYKLVNREISTSWPQWKKTAYESNFVITSNTKKIAY